VKLCLPTTCVKLCLPTTYVKLCLPSTYVKLWNFDPFYHVLNLSAVKLAQVKSLMVSSCTQHSSLLLYVHNHFQGTSF
jgi:hypothetical protein